MIFLKQIIKLTLEKNNYYPGQPINPTFNLCIFYSPCQILLFLSLTLNEITQKPLKSKLRGFLGSTYNYVPTTTPVSKGF